MTDPYQVLGVTSSSTDDEVKKAYRSLSKKYHPDANVDAPNKEELTEKFKQVQNAYDTIMDMRKRGYTGSYQNYQQSQAQSQYGSYTQYSSADFEDLFEFFRNASFSGFQNTGYSSQGGSQFSTISQLINMGRYQDALNELSRISAYDPAWYYYSAICHYHLGNNVTAQEHIRRAVEMDPNNTTYRQMYQSMYQRSNQYRTYSRTYGNTASSYASCCYRFLLLNAILSCCCGRGGFYPIVCC